MDSLRNEVMVNQFVMVAGCAREQARQLLQGANWQFETALSMFFQEAAVSCSTSSRQNSFQMLQTPANTPATPPNFPDALMAFGKMSTSDKLGTSPSAHMSTSPVSSMMPPPPPPHGAPFGSPAGAAFSPANHSTMYGSPANHSTMYGSPANHSGAAFSPANHFSPGASPRACSQPMQVESRR
ncbi:UBA-like domain-containing protein 1 [Amphibalanus amphitrite]|uniref:UBA-like domain-containing protein 1 n=1 Tax=Amphibalanus amphitrite TaxID=1232801 RepID=UPI001C91F8E2|nr:UBA-like domain-containing protein 1 [Amphibalanus amphitrite]XP_043209373.1 UBA-like domain-containing protein 1 [Amphibalanus amphitrite]